MNAAVTSPCARNYHYKIGVKDLYYAPFGARSSGRRRCRDRCWYRCVRLAVVSLNAFCWTAAGYNTPVPRGTSTRPLRYLPEPGAPASCTTLVEIGRYHTEFASQETPKQPQKKTEHRKYIIPPFTIARARIMFLFPLPFPSLLLSPPHRQLTCG